MTKIYLVRHCFSETNDLGIFAGWYDADISATGAKQLELLSERFKSISLDKIYSSPLKRAYKTALAVNKHPKAELVTDERLKELYIGELEGKSFNDMTDEQKRTWQNDFENFRSEGELPQECYDRIKNALLEIALENDGKIIAVASHGAVLRMFCCFVKGCGLEMYNKIEGMRNTAVTLLNFSPEKGFEIELENDVSHLESDSSLITSGWKFNNK